MDPKSTGLQQPKLDEHLVEGETREEMLRGERIYADHARRRSEHPRRASPIPIRALLDAALADDAVVDALDVKGNRRLRAIKAREHERGLTQRMSKGLVEGIESICRILDVELSPERRADLQSLDTAGLERLLAQLETERRWP